MISPIIVLSSYVVCASQCVDELFLLQTATQFHAQPALPANDTAALMRLAHAQPRKRKSSSAIVLNSSWDEISSVQNVRHVRLLSGQRSSGVGDFFGDVLDGIVDGVKTVGDGIVDAVTTVGDVIGDVVKNGIIEPLKHSGLVAIVWLLDKIGQLPNEEEASLGGHSREFCNKAFCCMVGAILAALLLGILMDNVIFPVFSKGRAGATEFLTLAATYALLIPAILGVLFSFNLYICIELLGAEVRYNLTRDDDNQPAALTESMWSLITVLVDSGGYLGAVLVVVYAMVIPVLKLLLLLFGECWRSSKIAARVETARTCILTVQFISKWASPDIFAYILLAHLFRGLNHPPKLKAQSVLDIGFLAFSLFCIFSTICTLGLKLPEVPKQLESPRRRTASLSSKGAFLVVLLLAGGFVVLLILGIHKPCMSIRLDYSALLGGGSLPGALEDEIKDLGLDDLINSDVSLSSCITALYENEELKKDSTLMMSFILLNVFVLLLTVLDMVFIVLAAFVGCFEKVLGEIKGFFFSFATVLKHLCMLDVCVMGVVVVCFAGAPYASQGVVLQIESGLIWLASAVVLQYAAYYLVAASQES